MDMNRRNVLVGLGAVAAGGGAVLGTGAFSSVQADRQVAVTTAGDGSALLGLSVDTSYNGISSDSPTGTNSETIIDINLDDINDDAVTTFDAALTVDNGGSDQVSLNIDTSNLEGITFTPGSSTLDADDGADGGPDETNVNVKVDTTGTVSGGTVTITAN